MIIRNIDKNTILAEECRIAGSFLSRFMGLMGKPALNTRCGLLIIPCNSIHMFFMRFPIDAVFLDRSNKIVFMAEGLKPWRVSKIIKEAQKVIELPSGTVKSNMTEVGDRLELLI